MLNEGARVDDDAGGAPVEASLQGFEQPDQRARLELAELYDRVWPQVTDLQHEGPPLQAGDERSGKPAEELWRRGNDDVWLCDVPGSDNGGQAE